MDAEAPPHGGWTAPGRGSLWAAGARAALTSALVNGVVVVLAVVTGVFPELHILPFSGGTFGLGSVVLISVVAALAGTALFSLIWPRAERPMHVFALFVSCALLVSFAAPMFDENWTMVRLGVIELTHLIVAGLTIYALWRWTRARRHFHEARGG